MEFKPTRKEVVHAKRLAFRCEFQSELAVKYADKGRPELARMHGITAGYYSNDAFALSTHVANR